MKKGLIALGFLSALPAGKLFGRLVGWGEWNYVMVLQFCLCAGGASSVGGVQRVMRRVLGG